MPPTALISSLDAIRRRVRTLGVVYGVGITIAAVLGLLVGTVLFDYMLNLPPAPRLVLMLIALGFGIYVIRRWVCEACHDPAGAFRCRGQARACVS